MALIFSEEEFDALQQQHPDKLIVLMVRGGGGSTYLLKWNAVMPTMARRLSLVPVPV